MMSQNRRVVVTGIGAVTPLGNNAADTWQNMKSGRNGIAPITHFNTDNFKAKLGAEVKGFDPKEYLEVNEVLRTDRFAQFAVAASQQAVEESGVKGTVEPERFAVLFGTGIGGIGTFETEHTKLMEKGPRRVSPLFVPMMIGNMASGLIAIRHDCRGPAMPAVTACASGSNAIGEAMRLVRHGYADAVITGGAEASIVPIAVAGFSNMKALSVSEDPDAASLPFDKRRGGFVIGEGSVALVLEEYEHAKARGAKIYGEVCGYGSTCDAYHITAPHPDGRGGAQAMDAVETIAIRKALGEENAGKAFVSSTKSMTGHMLGAAGAVEAMACLFALNEGIIPPTINLLEQDEQCDLNCVPNTAVKAEITLALSNSLGFGGHNACLAFRKV